MRVLVAGASGAIGRELVAELHRAGHEVIGVTRSQAGGDLVRQLGGRPVVADVLDRAGLPRALDGLTADAVVHEATALRVAPTHYRGRGITQTNRLRTTGTACLLDAARLLGATRFVVQSMIFGYGFVDHGERWVTEDAPFGERRGAKSDEASAALGEAERQVLHADGADRPGGADRPDGVEGIDGVALRYGFVYGPGPASEHLVTMLRRRLFPLPPGGGGHLGWLFVRDAATATVAAIERGRPGQVYNVVDDQPATWAEVMDALAAAVGARAPRRVPVPLIRLVAPFFAEQMIDTSMRVSNAKAKTELGWRPTMPSYREGVRATVVATRG
jgi:nucleoside-diphosphate-sugar epimerase